MRCETFAAPFRLLYTEVTANRVGITSVCDLDSPSLHHCSNDLYTINENHDIIYSEEARCQLALAL